MSDATLPGGSSAAPGAAASGSAADVDAAVDARPSIRVVAGNPTDDELAAAHAVIMAVLAEQAALGAEPSERPVDRWQRSARSMRGHIAPGPGAWAGTRGMRGF